jgi:DNA adenine methylase
MGRTPKQHEQIEETFDGVLEAIANENMPDKSFTAKPFVKWVGGKRSIIQELIARVPKEYNAYHEPFLGGGALFFALNPEKAYLSDINFYLAITYRAVKEDVDRLILNLKIHKKNHCLEYYQKARIRLNKEQDPVKVAALFIYINKTCYNGLYRVNKSGFFNVPMGKYIDPAILDEDNLRACSLFLKNTEVMQHTFAHIKPTKGDFYYLDPPYHETFSGYDGSGFGDEEHTKLAQFCRDIDAKGGYFMLSNSDTPFVRELYKGYNIETVSASRFISCKANDRNKQNELIIRNYA